MTAANAWKWAMALGLLIVAGVAIARSSPAIQRHLAIGTQAASSDQSQSSLPLDQRLYIFDVEALTVHLDGTILPALANALATSDRDGLLRPLSKTFRGHLPPDEPEETIEHAGCTVRIWGESTTETGADGFVDWLLAWRERLQKLGSRSELTAIQGVWIRVAKLKADQQENLAGSFSGSFDLRMWGFDDKGRPLELRAKLGFTASGLQEETVSEPGWLTSCEFVQVIASRSDRFFMEEVTAESGIELLPLWNNWRRQREQNRLAVTGSVHLADFNSDGWTDMVVADVVNLWVYHGRPGGRFEDVSEKVGIRDRQWTSQPNVLVADLDNDGALDMIAGPWVFRNRGDGTFEDVTEATNLPRGVREMASCVADYDNDGLVDIYALNLIPVPADLLNNSWIDDHSGGGNVLMKNLGNWQFSNTTDKANAGGGFHTNTASIFYDLDGDGWSDILACNEFGPNQYLRNRGDGTFEEIESPEVYGGFSMGLTAGDIDNDGLGDIYIANMYSTMGERIVSQIPKGLYPDHVEDKVRDFLSGNELLCMQPDGSLVRRGAAAGINHVGWAYGPGFVDLDLDGQLDIYAPSGYMSVSRNEPDG